MDSETEESSLGIDGVGRQENHEQYFLTSASYQTEHACQERYQPLPASAEVFASVEGSGHVDHGAAVPSLRCLQHVVQSNVDVLIILLQHQQRNTVHYCTMHSVLYS